MEDMVAIEKSLQKVDNAHGQGGTCRSCGARLSVTFVDLGMSPLSNAYLRADQLNRMERFYPLHVYVCERCFLVQLSQFESPETIFREYAYFSSYADSWLEHARNYVDMACSRFDLNNQSMVVELASNDGYLLQYFMKRRVPVLGIEPAGNVAEEAEAKGVPTLAEFFGGRTAQELVDEGTTADLIVANNVLAHVPDLNDFVAGMKILLAPMGVITIEFPHLLRLINDNQFDTIYHEHFSYFSFFAAEAVFERHGLRVFDVEELPTHGGSLRVFLRHKDDSSHPILPRVAEMRVREDMAGFGTIDSYLGFAARVKEAKRDLLEFLIGAARDGHLVAGYGAPAKGNTLLNYCGVRTDLVPFSVDRNPHKQGLFLPGTHIPIHHPNRIVETRPRFVLILPWNLKDEIMAQMSCIREWGGEFVTPIPKTRTHP